MLQGRVLEGSVVLRVGESKKRTNHVRVPSQGPPGMVGLMAIPTTATTTTYVHDGLSKKNNLIESGPSRAKASLVRRKEGVALD